MDGVTPISAELQTPVLAVVAMPAEAPLDMPMQSLRRFERKSRRRWAAPELAYKPWFSRLFVFGGALALTLYGAQEMYGVVNVGSITPLKWALLILFLANFSWIALAFISGVLGFLWLLLRAPRSQATPQSLSRRSAVVMPIYNEAPSRVFGALQAMYEDVAATGLGGHFDWFFLSDTTNSDIWIAEERAFLAMRERLGGGANIFYRHRPKNVSRKAGNIGDFVSRWGGAYEHMVVLDADSLMTGHAIVSLAATMEADPDAGIIQTLPLIINRNTIFARVQQFAARIYGPVIAAGLAVWSGRDGNYWGHNAIIRTAAFAAHCNLPNLRGRPPFGGHILSHDFIEAALIRRAGYAVYMLPVLGGSYEESPPSLIDLAARDRRWCQGNLQHSRIIAARGLKLASRQHLATGIMSYLASPLWMAQLLIGIALVLQSAYIRPEYFTNEFTLFPTWPRFDAARALALFEVTMAVLLTPKFLGLLIAIMQKRTRRRCGGIIRLVVSALFETLISALIAPIMMVIQTGSVMQIVFGRDTGWNPQRRDDGSIPFRAIVRRHRSHVALGLVTLVAGLLISPSLVAWMSPTIVGLLLAIAISWASGQLAIGLAFKRVGLLVTPEEAEPPPIAIRANALARDLAALGNDEADGLLVVHCDAAFRAQHEQFLPPAPRRHRGVIDPERAVAEAKLNDAETIDDAVRWLQPKERVVVLHDRALIDLLARLPPAEPARAEESAAA
ncbi:MAG TPA: glucans biosynthesis glucosyltransferase MdoH [Beijerinckiaceae bacterium]|jgi:membrane glycosyltransferase|nr:glucans biosynthesis glucosyltransferase MdoH [Beijerinckiaceae bacterium]